MPVEFKDYYKILGVSRHAGGSDIKRAFRRLAREHHPDVARDKAGAEEKFKEINEAYEVLSDPERRQKYNALGAGWKHGAQFEPPAGWGQRAAWHPAGGSKDFGGFEFHFGGTGFSDFFEQLFGSMGGGRTASGFRGDSDTFSRPGPDVEADLLVTLDEVSHGVLRRISLRRRTRCAACRGSGVLNRNRCATCAGKGETERTDQYTVRIPPGVREGHRLRLAVRGESGGKHGPAGDLFLRVRLARHPDYQVEGRDLMYDLDLAPWDAVLGSLVSIPTLDGKVNIRIPPGSQNGRRLRIRSQGLPEHGGGRGDFYVVIRIKMPEKLSERERSLWEKIARESQGRPAE